MLGIGGRAVSSLAVESLYCAALCASMAWHIAMLQVLENWQGRRARRVRELQGSHSGKALWCAQAARRSQGPQRAAGACAAQAAVQASAPTGVLHASLNARGRAHTHARAHARLPARRRIRQASSQSIQCREAQVERLNTHRSGREMVHPLERKPPPGYQSLPHCAVLPPSTPPAGGAQPKGPKPHSGPAPACAAAAAGGARRPAPPAAEYTLPRKTGALSPASPIPRSLRALPAHSI